ncbi:PucR family transcriptional regulator [Lacticaseibacillus rhamnosus]
MERGLGDQRDDSGPRRRGQRREKPRQHEFLATGGSYAATATHLTVHKNTVQYRLRKVEELLGYAVGAGHGELDLAIRACRHLGRAVMTTATTG